MSSKRSMVILTLIVALSMLLAACGAPATIAPTDAPGGETPVAETPAGDPGQGDPVAASFTTPHPILSDIKVRQAMAYCTNKDEIIQAVYPALSAEERKALVMDTFIPKAHWAYAGDENVTIYPFDPEKGKALLDEAGWVDPDETGMRSKDGKPLTLTILLTEAAHRKIWAAVWQQQMAACGFRIAVNHVPADWLYGDTTGLNHREYELSGYAWQGQSDPQGRTLYSCDYIPVPENGWMGQNTMGWCNEVASNAIIKATNALNQADRIEPYKIAQQEFTKDMVSLPIYNHLEMYATNPNLTGFAPKAGEEYYTYNAYEWAIPGKDTIVIGFTQEPASLFTLVESQFSATLANSLIQGISYSTIDYDFQPMMQTAASTLDSGLAQNNDVEVKEGDKVVDIAGNPVTLEKGVKVFDAAGNEVEFDGTPVKMKQLVVKYEFRDDLKFSDGEPLKAEDIEMHFKIDCAKDSGATSFTNCDNTLKYEVTDNSYTITYVPGVQDPLYFRNLADPRFNNWYPAHRVLSDGRKLGDVPAAEWATLPEIAESPIGVGPYMIKEWLKGEKIVLEANPYFYGPAPKTKTIVIAFVSPENAEAQLLSGQIDILDNTTLTTSSEALSNAAAEGKIKLYALPGGTWEHIDTNLFLP